MFIVLDGIDYSGKSTLANKLQTYFKSRGEKAKVFANPMKHDVSGRIRALFKSKHYRRNNVLTDSLLMSACLLELHHEMEVCKQQGITHFIVDRHLLSGVVYQGYMNQRVDDIKDFYFNHLQSLLEREYGYHMPDIYYVLHIDKDEYIKRKKSRDNGTTQDRFDGLSIESMMNLQDAYLKETKMSINPIHQEIKHNQLYFHYHQDDTLQYGRHIGIYDSDDDTFKRLVEGIENYLFVFDHGE